MAVKDEMVMAESVKGKLGCVPASVSFYEDMTTLELLDFLGQAKGVAPDRRYRQIKEAVSLLRLEKHQNKPLGKLSTYVRRRILLAGALLGNPHVILCEEPFEGLNAAQTRDLTDLLCKIGQMKPILLLSVSADILSFCQETCVLSKDCIHYTGSAQGYIQRLAGTVKLSLTLSDMPDALQEALANLEALEVVSVCEDDAKIVVRYAANRDLEKTVIALCESHGCAVRVVERLTPNAADRMDEKEDVE